MSEQLHVTGKSFTCYFAGKIPNGREYCRVLTSRRTYLRNRQFLVKTFIPHCCRVADHRKCWFTFEPASAVSDLVTYAQMVCLSQGGALIDKQ